MQTLAEGLTGPGPSTLALGALTSAATAEPATPPPATTGPVTLTDSQMDKVTAGAVPALQGGGQDTAFFAGGQGWQAGSFGVVNAFIKTGGTPWPCCGTELTVPSTPGQTQ
jgi:hypothetical protein